MSAPRASLETATARAALDRVIAEANHIILGKEEVIRLALACLIARGHLLIEDMPGVGKTTLAHVLAATLGLGFQRIQFTSDLLPADILGVSVFDQRDHNFHFGLRVCTGVHIPVCQIADPKGIKKASASGAGGFGAGLFPCYVSPGLEMVLCILCRVSRFGLLCIPTQSAISGIAGQCRTKQQGL